MTRLEVDVARPTAVDALAAPIPLEPRHVDRLAEDPRRSPRLWRDRVTGPWGLAVLVALAGVAAAIWSAHEHTLLAYPDARSHITIARRLLDGTNHGFVQIGTVWLPLQHIVSAPFAAIDVLWTSGWAAVPVGVACLVIEALAVYGIVMLLVGSRLGAWTAALLATLTPSVLYLHTTAATEPVLDAALAVTVYSLTRWAVRSKPASGGEIVVLCGIPALAASLSRYDGWAFVLAASVLVAWIAWRRWRRPAYVWRATRHFLILPALGAAWWLWFNFVNWGDPLEWQRGPYSAQAQQRALAAQGLLPDQGDVLRSIDTYLHSVLRGPGLLLVLAGIVGMVVWAVRTRMRYWTLAPWLLVAVPAGFYLFSLWSGQVAMRVASVPGLGLYNLRFGAAVSTGLALFAGFTVGLLTGHRVHPEPVEARLEPASPAWSVGSLTPEQASRVPDRPRRGLGGAVAVVLLAGAVVVPWTHVDRVGVVAEAREQVVVGRDSRTCAEWLRDHAGDAKILIDDSTHAWLPVIGRVDGIVAPFIGENRWQHALRHPEESRYVFVDVTSGNDVVLAALKKQPGFLRDTPVVCSSGPIRVFDTGGS